MNLDEKDRLFEILLYLYFSNFSEEMTKKAEFWNTLNALCSVFGISNTAIIRSIRILMASENVPQDDETYYLLNKLGLTVRPIRKISGIYWQKQKAFAEEFAIKPPLIHRRIVDVVLRKNIRDFILAIYQFTGIFSYVDVKFIEEF